MKIILNTIALYVIFSIIINNITAQTNSTVTNTTDTNKTDTNTTDTNKTDTKTDDKNKILGDFVCEDYINKPIKIVIIIFIFINILIFCIK